MKTPEGFRIANVSDVNVEADLFYFNADMSEPALMQVEERQIITTLGKEVDEEGYPVEEGTTAHLKWSFPDCEVYLPHFGYLCENILVKELLENTEQEDEVNKEEVPV